MNRDTKEEQKQIDCKLVDVAYGATSGAAIGARIGVAAAIVAGDSSASIIPAVGAVAGSLSGLFAVATITNRVDEKQDNSSEPEK
ncbi:MAG: hypothetical protein AAFY63_04665 [Cyanobacteria bacterium J06643_13]